jgi:hypothetical protein
MRAVHAEDLLARIADGLERVADELKAAREQAHADWEKTNWIPMGVFKEMPSAGGVPDLAALRRKGQPTSGN